jgi:sterol desaturase/sphingolipid hydroxylase (fatty acid hydroxylase superfamily)
LDLNYFLILGSFYALVAWTFLHAEKRKSALRRSRGEWLLDIIGLSIHGLLVPVLQLFVIIAGLKFLFPSLAGSIVMPGWLAFVLAFGAVDYLYYWNHRLLHHPWFWRWHSVHHSSECLDVFATSRNSFLTSFFILYLWVNGVMLYLLHDKGAYAAGVAFTSILDIVRHSAVPAWPRRIPFTWLISPKEHAWHHSSDTYDINFSGNFNLWDRLHGTYLDRAHFPDRTGFALKEFSLWAIFWKGKA